MAPTDPLTVEYERFDARCADALTDLAGAALAAQTDADRATIVVHVETHAAELDNGIALSGVRLAELACAAHDSTDPGMAGADGPPTRPVLGEFVSESGDGVRDQRQLAGASP